MPCHVVISSYASQTELQNATMQTRSHKSLFLSAYLLVAYCYNRKWECAHNNMMFESRCLYKSAHSFNLTIRPRGMLVSIPFPIGKSDTTLCLMEIPDVNTDLTRPLQEKHCSHPMCIS